MSAFPQFLLQTPLTGQRLRDIKPPLDVPDNLLIYIFLGGILFLAIIATIWVYLRKRKKITEPPLTEEIVVNPPDKFAFEQLNKLKDTPCDMETYHTRISYIIREYIAERYCIPALALTTTKLLHLMTRKQIDDLNTERIQLFFENCDTVKFAMRQPNLSEIDARMEDALWFVNVTKSTS